MSDLMRDLEYFAQKYGELINSKEREYKDFVSVDPRIKIKGVPQEPGVYIVYERGRPVYVGSSGRGKANLRTRFHDSFYFNQNPESKDPWNHTLSHKLMDPQRIGRFKTIDKLRDAAFNVQKQARRTGKAVIAAITTLSPFLLWQRTPKQRREPQP